MELREPVHIFSVPQNIVNTLSVRAGTQRSHAEHPATFVPFDVETSDPSRSLSCTLCLGTVFGNLNEQRGHFRSDWHRYNVKSRLQDANSKPVSETAFADLVEGKYMSVRMNEVVLIICGGQKALEDSLSGSASSSEEDEDDSSDDAVGALIEKHRKHRINTEQDDIGDDEPTVPRSPITWFQSPEAPNTQLGAYNVIFPSSAPPDEYPGALRDMQNGGSTGRSWALFMTAGGHFAGMIARVSRPGIAIVDSAQPPTSKKPKGGVKPIPDLEILTHKTFHRYTSQLYSPFREAILGGIGHSS